MSHVGIVGAGWAGLAAAVVALEHGHQVSVWDARREPGGRARSQPPHDDAHAPQGPDNGQHLLMSAYSAVADLLARIGVDRAQVLLETPLDLRDALGCGLSLPQTRRRIPASIQLAWSLGRARGWSASDKASLLRWSWRVRGRVPPAEANVQSWLDGLSARVRDQLMTPLCVSALNLPPQQASATLFCRVLQDTLWASPRHWRLWLPRVALGEVFAEPALRWLRARGAQIHLGERIQRVQLIASGIRLQSAFDVDHLILAAPAGAAAQLAAQLPHASAQDWARSSAALQHTAIATAYARAPGLRLPRPMLRLRADHPHDAQFVFDLGRLGQRAGDLAAVLSAAPTDSDGLKEHLQGQLRQALGDPCLSVHQLVIEKRAAFAATPNVQRPAYKVCPKVWACGDYVQGPYPSTLEGAVRSALQLPWASLAV